jgi:hypothetical protein
MKSRHYLLLASLIFSMSGHAADKKKVYSKRSPIKAPTASCEKSYKKAKDSPSTGDVIIAVENCEKATEGLCSAMVMRDSDGASTGDGRYIGALCELTAAYGGNKAVNKFVPSPACQSAYGKAKDSPSTGDVYEAAKICKDEQDKACQKMVEQSSDGPTTGDGRYIGASCALIAAHGAFVEVQMMGKSGSSGEKTGKSSGATR